MARGARGDISRAHAYLELGRTLFCDPKRRREATACFDAAYRADETNVEAVQLLVMGLAAMKAFERLDDLWLSLPVDGSRHVKAARQAIRLATHRFFRTRAR